MKRVYNLSCNLKKTKKCDYFKLVGVNNENHDKFTLFHSPVITGREFMQLLVCTSLVMSEDKRTRMLIEAPEIHWWSKTGELHCPVYQLNMHFRALFMPRLRESNTHAVSTVIGSPST